MSAPLTNADARRRGSGGLGLGWFPVEAGLPDVEVGQLRHARLDADPAHRWLRGTVADALH
ncbi:hypothetical protein [Cryptosporangium sp. NPDC051539]|uniref:hypothetical protein n=1 Tax=Cryptosporangium sp. NPDC051539 TaxID=3363962 RepID=UPI0037AB4710